LAGSYGTVSSGHFYFCSRFSLEGTHWKGANGKGCFMPYWIHCDKQAQHGDLRRVQILTSDDLTLREDLRGPFNTLTETLVIAESLIWSIVATIMDRLRTEKPKKFADFPSGEQNTEE
jgi:hypothetical protein